MQVEFIEADPRQGRKGKDVSRYILLGIQFMHTAEFDGILQIRLIEPAKITLKRGADTGKSLTFRLKPSITGMKQIPITKNTSLIKTGTKFNMVVDRTGCE